MQVEPPGYSLIIAIIIISSIIIHFIIITVSLLVLLFHRESARIQFRLPDASTVVQIFPSSEPLSTAHDFILNVSSYLLG